MSENNLLRLKIKQIRQEAYGIHSYELIREDGSALPRFDAGAHIDVHLISGIVRQYSLSNDSAECHRYVLGVLCDEMGRGGSKELHNSIREGDFIDVSVPRNHFRLDEGAQKVILLAGGIGITPLKSMAHRLSALKIPFELHYCARASENIAFSEELQLLSKSGTVQFHLDGGRPEQGLNMTYLVQEMHAGDHLYCCGPSGFMRACEQAVKDRPDIQVHFEHFKTPEKELPNTFAEDAGELVIEVRSTGQKTSLARSESIVDALARIGIDLPTSCQSGLCGTCKTRYISGDVEHGDCILSDAEHVEYLTPCISHIKKGILVLDL